MKHKNQSCDKGMKLIKSRISFKGTSLGDLSCYIIKNLKTQMTFMTFAYKGTILEGKMAL